MIVVWLQVAFYAICLGLIVYLAIKRMRNDDRKDFENRSN
jgi:hypothetical protein